MGGMGSPEVDHPYPSRARGSSRCRHICGFDRELCVGVLSSTTLPPIERVFEPRRSCRSDIAVSLSRNQIPPRPVARRETPAATPLCRSTREPDSNTQLDRHFLYASRQHGAIFSALV